MIEPAKRSLGPEQDPPDQRRRVGDLLKALRRRCSPAHGREGRLDNIGRAQVLPVRVRKAIEGDHALPVGAQNFGRVGIGVAEALDETVALLLGLLPRLGVGHRAEQRSGFGLLLLRYAVAHVDDRVIPAPLLFDLREHLAHRRPDSEVTIRDDQLRHLDPARFQAPQEARPRLL